MAENVLSAWFGDIAKAIRSKTGGLESMKPEEFPDKIRAIEISCIGLEFVSNGDGTCYVSGIGDCTDADIVIPSVSPDGDIVTSIGEKAFYQCQSIGSVSIPDSVTTIGEQTFAYSSLKNITMGCSVTSIGDWAFMHSTIESIAVPEGVTSIGFAVFMGCSHLSNVIIPNSVTSIGGCSFASCYRLESITIPYKVTSIYQSAFNNCTSLAEIVIPYNVKYISDNAFEGCSNLTNATFKNTSGWSVYKIGTPMLKTSISAEELEDASTAAMYLRSTYSAKCWERR
jgi:hypothetical protein